MDPSEPVSSVPQSLPARFVAAKPHYNSELSDVAYSGKYEDSDSYNGEDNPLLLDPSRTGVQQGHRDRSLPVITGSYGAIPTSQSRRKRIASTSVASLTQVCPVLAYYLIYT